jgi:hypothetical protein
MPNGGIDNCGMCSFNRKNKGETGLGHYNDEGEPYCIIRNLPIQNSLYTYCANHPYNTPFEIDIPIGPVYEGVASGPYTKRGVWVASPDTEEIRLKLLELIRSIEEIPETFHSPNPWDDMVIWQLGEFREARAVDELQRIAAFDPDVTDPKIEYSRTRKITVELAKAALRRILGI